MSKNLNVNLTFKTNSSQVKNQIAELQQTLMRISTAASINVDSSQIKTASAAAKELQIHLANAMNTETGNLDLGKLSASLTKAKTDVASLSAGLLQAGNTGQQAFIQLAQSIAAAERPVVRINAHLSTLWTTMKNTARWQLTSSALHGFVGAVQEAHRYAQDLNESLNNIRIVTGQSIDQMSRFAEQANKAAKALSTTTTEYTDATLIYYQQGLNDKEVAERAETTIKMANVSRQSAEIVSDQMTAIWNNFYDGSKSLEYYGDVITELGAATASSSEEIATGLEKFAAVADTVGLSYEYATAALATVTATTRQSADVVGTAFKTLFARVQDLELGKTLDDGVTLGKYSEALNAVGISIMDQNGQLLEMDTILDKMGDKWSQLTKAQQVALAQTVAGTRQYTQLVALMDNWAYFQENLGTAMNSEGALQEQAEIYAESWEAARDRVTASAEHIYATLLDDKFFIGANNALSGFLDSTSAFIDGIGGLKGTVSLIASLLLGAFAGKIPSAINNLKLQFKSLFGMAQKDAINLANSMNQVVEKTLQTNKFPLTEEMKAALKNSQALNDSQNRYVQVEKDLTEEEKTRYQVELGIVKAQAQQVELASQQVDKLKEEINLAKEKALGAGPSRSINRYEDAEMERIANNVDNRAYQNYKNVAIAAAEATTAQQELRASIISTMEAEVTSGQKISQDINLRNQLNQTMQEQLVQFTNINLGQRKNIVSLQQYSGELNAITSGAIPGLTQALRNLEEAQVSGNSQNLVKRAQELREILKGFAQDGKVTLSSLSGVFGDSTDLEKIRQKLLQLIKAQKEAATAQENLNKATANYKPKHIGSPAESFMKLASAAGSASMAISSLSSGIRALADEDMSWGEKLTTLLMSFSMTIPIVTQGFKNLSTAQSVVNAATTAELVLAQAKINLIQNEAVAKGKLITIEQLEKSLGNQKMSQEAKEIALAQINLAIQKQQAMAIIEKLTVKQRALSLEQKEQAAQMLGITVEQLELELKNKKTKASIIERIQKIANIKLEKTETQTIYQKIVAHIAEKRALESKTAAMLTSLGIIGLIIAAAAALMVGITALIQAYKDEQEEMKMLNEALANVKQGYEDAKQAVEDFKTSINDYDDAIAAIDELTKGTGEYIKAIEEANQKTLELIETYGLYDQYSYDKEHPTLITLNDGVAEQIYEQLQRESYQQGQLYYSISLSQIQKSYDKQLDEIERNAKIALSNFSKEQLSEMLDTYQDQGNGIAVAHVRDYLDVLEKMESDSSIGYNQEQYYKNKYASENAFQGNDIIQSTAATLMAANKDMIAKIAEAAEADIVAESDGRERRNYIRKYANKNWDTNWGALDDKLLAQLYAEQYLGLSEDEYEYKHGAGKGTITVYNANGKTEEIEVNDNQMEIVLAQMVANAKMGAEEIDNAYAQQVSELGNTMTGFSEEAQTAMLDAATKWTGAKDEIMDLDFSLISPEEQKTMVAELDELGGNLAQAYLDALSNYDSSAYWDRIEAQQSAIIDEQITTNELDNDAIKLQAELIQKNTEGLAANTEQIEKNDNAARQLAVNNARMNEGLSELIDNWEDWRTVLNNGDKTTSEYAETLASLQDVMSDLLGLTDNLSGSLDADFLSSPETFELLEKAANGSVEAITELGFAVSKNLLNSFKVSEDYLSDEASEAIANASADERDRLIEKSIAQSEEEFTNLQTRMAEYINSMQEDILSKDFDLPNVKMDQFIADLNQMAAMTGMTVQDMQGMLNSMGLEANIKTTQVDFTSQVPVYRTVTVPATNWDGEGDAVDSYTWQVSSMPVTESRTVASIAYNKDAPSVNYVGHGNISAGNKQTIKGNQTKKSDLREQTKRPSGDRYKEIEDAMDDIAEAAEDVNRELDKMFGAGRLKEIDKLIKLQEKEIKQLERKKESAKGYLERDKNDLSEAALAAGVTFILENGNISNYTEEMDTLYAKLNIKEKTLRDAQSAGNDTETLEEEVEYLENLINKLEEAVGQYDETRELIEDIDDEIAEARDEILALNYQKITEKLEINIELNDADLKRIERQIAALGDDLFARAEVATIMSGYGAEYEDSLEAYRNFELELHDAFKDNNISQADYIDGLKQVQQGYWDNIDALREWKAEMKEYYADTLAAGNDEFQQFMDFMSQSTSVMEHYNNIIDLTGGQQDYDAKAIVLEGVEQARKDQVDTRKAYYEMMQAEADKQRAELEALNPADAAYEYAEAEWKVAQELANQAQNDMLSAIEEWAQAVADVLDNELAAAAKDLEKALTNGSSFDELNTAMERTRSLQEEWLTTTNKIYETNKLMRTAQTALDKTTNQAAKNRLQAFIKQTQQLQDQEELSEYELKLQSARYDLLLAEIALEEAQNSKSTVRLQRDSEGNFGYVYTADQDEIEKAQQDYEDADNALYKMGLEGYNEYIEKYTQTMQDFYSTITEINEKWRNNEYESEEEYQQALLDAQNYYSEKLADYTYLANAGLMAQSFDQFQEFKNGWNTKKDALDEEYKGKEYALYAELVNYASEFNDNLSVENAIRQDAWATTFTEMTNIGQSWSAAMDDYLTDVNNAFDNYHNNTTYINQMVGLSMDQTGSRADSLTGKIEELKNESGYYKDVIVGPDGHSGLIGDLQDLYTEVGDVTSAFQLQLPSIQNLEEEYEKWAREIQNVIDELLTLNSIQDTKIDLPDNSSGPVENVGEEGKPSLDLPNTGGDTVPILPKEDKSRKYGFITNDGHYHSSLYSTPEQAAEAAYKFSPTTIIFSFPADADTIAEGIYGMSQVGVASDYYKVSGSGYRYHGGSSGIGVNQIMKFNTGGYTGSWGPEGKMAMLHEKELILNPKDTENMLVAVSIVRDLMSMFDPVTLASLTTPLIGDIGSNLLEQSVKIEATFPSVTDRYEIEEALRNLTNTATQYANRKRL